MTPADQFQPKELVGRRVVFVTSEEHRVCWHFQVGLERGVVRKAAQTLAQKAEMVAEEGVSGDEYADYEDVPRVWVKAEPCEAFPRGCEAAVELECLLVLDLTEKG